MGTSTGLPGGTGGACAPMCELHGAYSGTEWSSVWLWGGRGVGGGIMNPRLSPTAARRGCSTQRCLHRAHFQRLWQDCADRTLQAASSASSLWLVLTAGPAWLTRLGYQGKMLTGPRAGGGHKWLLVIYLRRVWCLAPTHLDEEQKSLTGSGLMICFTFIDRSRGAIFALLKIP